MATNELFPTGSLESASYLLDGSSTHDKEITPYLAVRIPTFRAPAGRQETTPNSSIRGTLFKVDVQSKAAIPSTDRKDPRTGNGNSNLKTPQIGANMVHLELLCHISNATSQFSDKGVEEARTSAEVSIKHALTAPYLMNQLLALSALNLSILRPQQRDFYRDHATELQTSALSLFNNLAPGFAEENIIPTFLFSTFLGAHTLFETLLFRPSDFSLFIDRFVGCLRLHRGVHTVIKNSWSWLQSTELEPMLNVKERKDTDPEKGTECSSLLALLHSADLSQPSIDVCKKALDDLQWMFDLARLRQSIGSGPSRAELILAWLIRMSPGFADLLLLRKPEALAILAHYAVLLHWGSDLWLVNDGGKFLIESIMGYLGSHWEGWLELPHSVLLEKRSS